MPRGVWLSVEARYRVFILFTIHHFDTSKVYDLLFIDVPLCDKLFPSTSPRTFGCIHPFVCHTLSVPFHTYQMSITRTFTGTHLCPTIPRPKSPTFLSHIYANTNELTHPHFPSQNSSPTILESVNSQSVHPSKSLPSPNIQQDTINRRLFQTRPSYLTSYTSTILFIPGIPLFNDTITHSLSQVHSVRHRVPQFLHHPTPCVSDASLISHFCSRLSQAKQHLLSTFKCVFSSGLFTAIKFQRSLEPHLNRFTQGGCWYHHRLRQCFPNWDMWQRNKFATGT